MPRRLIDSSLSRSKKFNSGIPQEPGNALNHFARLLYIHLISHADRWGRGEGDPFDIKTMCIPHYRESEEDIRTALTLLHNVELIIWYESENSIVYQIVDWDEHQNFNEHNRKGESKYDEPPTRDQIEQSPTVPVSFRVIISTRTRNKNKLTKSNISKAKDITAQISELEKLLKSGKDEYGIRLNASSARSLKNKIAVLQSNIDDLQNESEEDNDYDKE